MLEHNCPEEDEGEEEGFLVLDKYALTAGMSSQANTLPSGGPSVPSFVNDGLTASTHKAHHHVIDKIVDLVHCTLTPFWLGEGCGSRVGLCAFLPRRTAVSEKKKVLKTMQGRKWKMLLTVKGFM